MIKIIYSTLAPAIVITAFAFATPVLPEDFTYTVDVKKSTAIWLGKKLTGEHGGGISLSKGIVISNGKKITSGSVEFDMNSMTNTDIADKKWSDKLIEHLRNDDFFSVDKYPTSKFEITKVQKKDADYEVTGKLTIKGVTNEINFPAMIKMDEKTLVVIAKISIDRTKFDIKYGSADFSDKIGDKAINNNFELNVNLVAEADVK